MVSVCLASYNGEKFIKAQIDSILSQLNNEDELIISDDSSSDNTPEILVGYSKIDSRVKLYLYNQFKNPVRNFEFALSTAKGDYIFLSDQDDIWENHKISTMINHLKNVDLVVSDCKFVNQELQLINESYFKMVKANQGLIRNLFFKTSPYIGCCMAFNRNVLTRALPIPKKVINHDYWIAMVAEAFYKVKLIHEPLIQFRRHTTNASSTGKKSANSVWFKIEKRINIILPLLARTLHY